MSRHEGDEMHLMSVVVKEQSTAQPGAAVMLLLVLWFSPPYTAMAQGFDAARTSLWLGRPFTFLHTWRAAA
jgi:hypothetical protein